MLAEIMSVAERADWPDALEILAAAVVITIGKGNSDAYSHYNDCLGVYLIRMSQQLEKAAQRG